MIESYLTLHSTIYNSVLQATLAPTNMYRDTKHYSDYLKSSVFLPMINNEVDHPKFN